MKLGRRIAADPKIDSALLRESLRGSPAEFIEVIVDVGDGQAAIPPELETPYRTHADGWRRALGQRPRIVTGRIARANIVPVLTGPYVVRAQAASPVYPQMRHSIPIMGLPALGEPRNGLTGKGVVIGIVDDGCDWGHRNFRNADGSSRVAYLWDQTPTADEPSGRPAAPQLFDYGREFTGEMLTAALAGRTSVDAYRHVRYSISPGAHGTSVMDIAAGNGRAPSCPAIGMAPKATIVFVQLPPAVVARADRLGHSQYVIDAVHYVFAKSEAMGLPAVVNLSLAGHHGPHDGTALLDAALDDVLNPFRDDRGGGRKARAIVAAAGNGRRANAHAHCVLAAWATRSLSWRIPVSDPTANHLELWCRPEPLLSFRLRAPDGTLLGPFDHDHGVVIEDHGSEIGWVCRRSFDAGNGKAQIHIALTAGSGPRAAVTAGDWELQFLNASGHDLPLDAWITRDDIGLEPEGQQSRLIDRDRSWVVDECTIATPASAKSVVAVGAYDGRGGDAPAAAYSAGGRLRDNEMTMKPDVTAPAASRSDSGADGIACARALDSETHQVAGTSAAAPHITGLIALMMQEDPQIHTTRIRRRLVAPGPGRQPAIGESAPRPRWPLAT